jgi:hypothetical protein
VKQEWKDKMRLQKENCLFSLRRIKKYRSIASSRGEDLFLRAMNKTQYWWKEPLIAPAANQLLLFHLLQYQHPLHPLHIFSLLSSFHPIAPQSFLPLHLTFLFLL